MKPVTLGQVIFEITLGSSDYFRNGQRIYFDANEYYPFRVGDTYFISFKGWEKWYILK